MTVMPCASNKSLAYYETIGLTSRAMLDAAHRGDWAALAEAERCCVTLIEQLKAMPSDEARLDARGSRRKREIMRRLLAEDAQIRALVQPWPATLEACFGRGSARPRAEDD